MEDDELDGTRVLERLAETGRLDAFFAAVDRDDATEAARLMRAAGIGQATVAAVERMIARGDVDG